MVSKSVRGQIMSTDLITSASIYLLLIGGIMSFAGFADARSRQALMDRSLCLDTILLAQDIVMGNKDPLISQRPRHVDPERLRRVQIKNLPKQRSVHIELSMLDGAKIMSQGSLSGSKHSHTVSRIVFCEGALCELRVTVEEIRI